VPGRIISRFRKSHFGELGTGHITDDYELGAAGNSRCRLVRPVGAAVGDLSLDRFGAFFLASPLCHSKGSFMSTREVLAAVDNAIRAGNLVDQPQVNADLCLSNGL